MSKPCCGTSPIILKGDGKSYCSECGDEKPLPTNIDDMDWSDLFPQVSNKSNLKCECGSDALGSDKHSSWCQKYEGFKS